MMKTFKEIRQELIESNSGKYKGVSWKLTKTGSSHTLFVDGDKIDTYKSEKEAVASAKEYIDLSK